MANYVPVGTFQCEDTEQPDVVGAAKEALKFYNEQTGTEYVLWEVTKAETQVTAGRNYRLTFKAHFHQGCILRDPVKCHALVFKNLQNKLSVKKIDCKPINRP